MPQQQLRPSLTADSAPAAEAGADTGYQQPWGNSGEPRGPAPLATSSFLEVVEDTHLHRTAGSTLLPMPLVVHIGDLVRLALPADGQPIPEHTLIATASELFGWVPDTSVTEVDGPARPSVGLGATTPTGDLPELRPEDYDRLEFVSAELPVRLIPADVGEPLATTRRMEAYVALETITREQVTWTRIRLVRDPPIVGWIAGFGRDVDAAPEQGMPETTDLALGATGPAVLALEETLSALGLSPGPVDTTFDEQTEAAVEAFQDTHELTVDGHVGPQTRAALRAARGGADPGRWMAGYTMTSASYPRAFTPGGDVTEAGYASATQGAVGRVTGDVEVLWVGNTPAVTEDGGKTYWYARAVDGSGSGWVESRWVGESDGARTASGSVRDEIAATCPNGYTASFVVQQDGQGRAFSTFLAEAGPFAASSNAVALSGGQLVTGTSNLITDKDDIVAILAEIQQLLRGDEPTVPPFARVAHIAVFTHGSRAPDSETVWGGLETDSGDWNAQDDGNVRMRDLEGLAGSLALLGTSDLRMSLFACWTGTAYDGSYSSAAPGTIVDESGEGSFADRLSDAMVGAGMEDGAVMGHTTLGPTVRNPDARLYDGDTSGVNPFNWALFPLWPWLGEELEAAGRTSMHDPMAKFTTGLWRWYQGAIIGDNTFATLMSTDPELFRVRAQREARIWLRGQLPSWGVYLGGVQLGSDVPVTARYNVGEVPSVKRDIPARAPLTIVGAPQEWHEQSVTPVQWEDEGQTWRGWVATSLVVEIPQENE